MPKWSVEAPDEDDKRVAHFLADHRGDFSSKKELILVAVREFLDNHQSKSNRQMALKALEDIDFTEHPKVTTPIDVVIKKGRNDRIR